MIKTEAYRIESHGIDAEQYFQAASALFTPFEHVVTGTGDTEAEAYEDAVDQIAWGYDDDLVGLLQLPKFWGDDEHNVCEDCMLSGDIEDCDEGCELHYYVSVYFNAGEN